jgi:hypothetical protein
MFAVLDDVCNFPKGTDDKYLGKLNEYFGQHAHFAPAGAAQFIIKHYAGNYSCLSNFHFNHFDSIPFDSIRLLAHAMHCRLLVGFVVCAFRGLFTVIVCVCGCVQVM